MKTDSKAPSLPGLLLLGLICTGPFLAGCQQSGSQTAGTMAAEPAAENYRDFRHADRLATYLRTAPRPLVSAHRGGPAEGFPENATQTFAHTLTHGPALIEADVRLTEDSVLVLMHDDTIGRTTTGEGEVREHTLRELRAVQLLANGGPTHYEVPTLPEALTWAEGRAVLQLDVKEDVPRPLVAETLRRHEALDQAMVITYTHADALWYHQRLPNLILSVSAESRNEAESLVQDIDPSRLVGWVGVGEVPNGPMDVFSNHDVPVAVGTFGETDRRARRQGLAVYHRLFDRGVDIVSTDEPNLANQAAGTYHSYGPPGSN